MKKKPSSSTTSLRWAILRQAFLSPSPSSSSSNHLDHLSKEGIQHISRKARHGFNLIPCHILKSCAIEDLDATTRVKDQDGSRDIFLCYRLPVGRAPELVLIQRVENYVNLNDFEICNQYDVDNTGLICNWPSEDVLAYFCLTHAEMFSSKRILELGSGYGLAGLAVAACTDASEVVISDGNPQVADYIQRNVRANAGAFGETQVKSMTLHWKKEHDLNIKNTFDVIIASDCTFFKEFHEGLALTVKSLLTPSDTSEALFFAPRRGNSLDKFLEKIKEVGLHFNVIEIYDPEVWKLHLKFVNGDDSSWPNYEKDHCYPLLVRITF